MGNITLSISDETKKRMKKHSSIKWSNVVRTVIERKLDEFEEAEKLANKGSLRMADIESTIKKVDEATRRHSRKLLNESYSRR